MDTRYFAFPVSDRAIDIALAHPWAFGLANPEAAPRRLDDVPTGVLSLGSCWGRLQCLTKPRGVPRAAHAMFEGHADPAPFGPRSRPWTRVLTPARVDDVANDLVLVGDDDIEDYVQRHHRGRARNVVDGERAFLRQKLDAAKGFAIAMQRRGWGFVYVIG